MLEHAASALLLDPGLGKTSIVLAAIKMLMKKGMIDRVLIVAPLRVCYMVWPLEIEKWNDFKHIKWAILHGKDKEAYLRSDANVFLINPEGLEWLLTKPRTRRIIDNETGEVQEITEQVRDTSKIKILNPDWFVVDESTKFKNSQSSRSKYVEMHIERFRRRTIMTGTFAPNGLMDLFGQMKIVDEGRSLGRYITQYRREYFDQTGFGGYTYKIREGAEQKIYKKIRPYALRMDADDYITLPQVRDNNIIVQMSEKGRKLYDEMYEEMLVVLDGKPIVAASSGVASMKCRQIVGGALYDNEPGVKRGKNDYKIVDTAKMEALEEFIEQRQGKPTLVMYEFEHELERMLKLFGKNTPYIGGGVTAAKSKLIGDRWNRNEIPILLGHGQSMGHGLNIQESECDALLWYSLPWDLEIYDQVIRRLKRRGSKHNHIMNHRIIVPDTTDILQLRALRRKDKDQRNLHDALKPKTRRKK